MRILSIVSFLIFFAAPLNLWAISPEETLADPQLEQQARNLFKEIRCVTCTSESINDSHAVIAANLRNLIRQQLAHGKSEEDIIAYLTSRYGNSILMRPPLMAPTYLLWFGPAIFFVIGGIAVAYFIKKQRDVSFKVIKK